MIRVYNDNEQILGSTGGGYIRTGEFQDFKISQANGQQAAFAILYGSTDAVCVPYVTTTWTDGQQFGWVGDWGKVCGLDWYYSNVYVDNSDKFVSPVIVTSQRGKMLTSPTENPSALGLTQTTPTASKSAPSPSTSPPSPHGAPTLAPPSHTAVPRPSARTARMTAAAPSWGGVR
jgi:hypothetical protein